MARKRVIGLTQEDRDYLNEALRELLGRAVGSGGRGSDLDDYPAPDVYVVKTPSSGISPITVETGTGTGLVGGDTGTGYEEVFRPPSAACQVYRLVEEDGYEQLVAVTSFILTVYCMSPLGVEGDRFVKVARDKYGTWWVDEPGLPYARCT